MRSMSHRPGLALLKALIQVRQHTRKDGTTVRAHTRNVQTRGERRALVATMAERMAGGAPVRHASLGSALGAARHASKVNGRAAHVYEHPEGGWVSTHDGSHTEGHDEKIVAVKGRARLHRAGEASRSLAHLKGPIAEHVEKPAPAPAPKVKPARPKAPPPAAEPVPAAPAADAAAARQREAVLPAERLTYPGAPEAVVYHDANNHSVVISFRGGVSTAATREALKARGFRYNEVGNDWYAPHTPEAVRLANYTRRRYNGLTPEEHAQREAWDTLTPAKRHAIAYEPLTQLGGAGPQHDNRPHGLLARARGLDLPVSPEMAQAVQAHDHLAMVQLHGAVHAAEGRRGREEELHDGVDPHPMALLKAASEAGLTFAPDEVQALVARQRPALLAAQTRVAEAQVQAKRRRALDNAGLTGGAQPRASFTAPIQVRRPGGGVAAVSHTFETGQRVLWSRKGQAVPVTLAGIMQKPGQAPTFQVFSDDGQPFNVPVAAIAGAPTYDAPPAQGPADGPRFVDAYTANIEVWEKRGDGAAGVRRPHTFRPGQRVRFADGRGFSTGVLLFIYQEAGKRQPTFRVVNDHTGEVHAVVADNMVRRVTYSRPPAQADELRKALEGPSSRLLVARL
jgi:hypothetical protein